MDNFRRILLGGNGGKPPVPSTPGVYAFFIDGSTSQATSYTESQKANIIGVLVVDNYKGALHKIVLDKADINSGYYVIGGGYKRPITGATKASNKEIAVKDMNGKANTIAISNACHRYDDSYRTGSVAEDCQTRLNEQGYLPSAGEWQMLYNNKSAITTMMSAIGGIALVEVWYWSSTLYDASTKSWCLDWNDNRGDGSARYGQRMVRAVLDPETYVVPPKTTDTPGVYAYFKDGSTSQATSYTESQKANILGVLVVANYPTSSDLHKIVLDKTDISASTLRYGGYNKPIYGGTIERTANTAVKDMYGKANTVAISNACYGYNDGYRTGSAAEDCQARFNEKGHLPSLGEWKMLYDNKSAIATMMSAIGGTALKENWYCSSTLYTENINSWDFNWKNAGKTISNRYANNRYVRAVMQVY